jgi:hypothetical protein
LVGTLDKSEAVEVYYEIEKDIFNWLSESSNEMEAAEQEESSEVILAKQACFRLLGLLLHECILHPPSTPTAGAIINMKVSESVKMALDRCVRLILAILSGRSDLKYCKVCCISSLWIISCQKWPSSLWNASAAASKTPLLAGNMTNSVSNFHAVLLSMGSLLKRTNSVAVQMQALVAYSKLLDTMPQSMRKHINIWLIDIFPLVVTGKARVIREKSLAIFSQTAKSLVCNTGSYPEAIVGATVDVSVS